MALVFGLGLTTIGTMSSFEAQSLKRAGSQPELYWYAFSGGNLTAELNGGVPQTKDESLPEGSNPLTTCDDVTSIDCIRGYDAPQTVPSIAPAPAGPDYHITKTSL